jgi:predicted transcriptional regulator
MKKLIEKEDDVLRPTVIKNIEQGVADIKAGRVYTSEQLKKKLTKKDIVKAVRSSRDER